MKIALVISTAVAVASAIDQHPTLLKTEARLSRRGITIGTVNRIVDEDGVVQEAHNGNINGEGILDGKGNPIDPATLSRGDLKQGGALHAPMTKEEEQELKKVMGEMSDSIKSNTDSSHLDRLLESVFKNEPLAEDQTEGLESVKQPPSAKPEPEEAPKKGPKEAPKEVAKEEPRRTPKQESSGSSGLFLKSEIEGSIHTSINPSTSNSSVTPGRFSRPVASESAPASNVVSYTSAGALSANQGVAVICAVAAAMLLLCF